MGKELNIKSNNLELKGTLLTPENDSLKKLVIFIHGSGPNDRDETIFENKPLKLTKTEFEILKYLMENKKGVVKRDDLLKCLSSIIQSDRSLDYHIKNIRIKLGDSGANPRYLVTEYALGYKLVF